MPLPLPLPLLAPSQWKRPLTISTVPGDYSCRCRCYFLPLPLDFHRCRCFDRCRYSCTVGVQAHRCNTVDLAACPSMLHTVRFVAIHRIALRASRKTGALGARFATSLRASAVLCDVVRTQEEAYTGILAVRDQSTLARATNAEGNALPSCAFARSLVFWAEKALATSMSGSSSTRRREALIRQRLVQLPAGESLQVRRGVKGPSDEV